MATSDKQQLLDMGFTIEKVESALKATKNAGLVPALDWLSSHAEDSENVNTPVEENEQPGDEISEAQQTPSSLKCDDCDKYFRDANAAERHAIKSNHVNFSESTTVIKPLTAEEKAAKMAALQELLKVKREERRLREIEEGKSKEKVRRKTGKEMQDLKEKFQDDEMKKALIAKEKEKREDRAAKERIRALLEADKAERLQKAEEKKRAAAGMATSAEPPKVTAVPVVSSKEYTETRIQFRFTEGQPVVQTFAATDKLSVVYEFIESARNIQNIRLMTTFPRKMFDASEKTKTLKELNLVPSASLVVQF